MSKKDLKDFSMLGLFLMEAESQAQILNEGLLKLEKGAPVPGDIEALMRAAHSLKGGARIIRSDILVGLTHAMEDYFSAVLKEKCSIREEHIDCLFNGADLIRKLSEVQESEFESFIADRRDSIVAMIQACKDFTEGKSPEPESLPAPAIAPEEEISVRKEPARENFVKVASEKMERLLGLAGESLVHERRLQTIENRVGEFRRIVARLTVLAENINERIAGTVAEDTREMLHEFSYDCDGLNWRMSELVGDCADFSLCLESYADSLYREVVSCKIIPFGYLSRVFPRMVRDVAKSLGKQVELEVSGEDTGLDRDIMEKLEAPLTHLLRNAVDHGVETPGQRLAAGKTATGTVRLSAFHWAGMFNIVITDDGHGIDLEDLRGQIERKGLARREMLKDMPERELLDFLFLPGFSTKESVSEISGRGVGLDIVMSMVQEVRGQITVRTEAGKSTTFHLQLPVSLSVLAALVVEIGEELYAFPATRVDRLLLVEPDEIKTMENSQFIEYAGRNIGVVSGCEVLGYPLRPLERKEISLLIVSDRYNQYAMVVDRFVREEKIVIRPLDERLGKISCVNAAAVLEGGEPALVVDVEDIVRSVDSYIKSGSLHKLKSQSDGESRLRRKKVLVIDDSITVRELERQILEACGYEVETAVNGVDGWNAARTGSFDLIITDIDMPRMNGFELTEKLKGNEKLRGIPIVIVSYKDREEDKVRGIEAGADYYLTKSSFHDNTLVEAVYTLIGDAVS